MLVVAVGLGVVGGAVPAYVVVSAPGEIGLVERGRRIGLSQDRGAPSRWVPEQRESRVLTGGDGWLVIGRLLPGVVGGVEGAGRGHHRTPHAPGQVTRPVGYGVGDGRSLGGRRG